MPSVEAIAGISTSATTGAPTFHGHHSGVRAAGLRAAARPLRPQGGSIRVRGWVENLNGPMIEVVIPEHIEVLDGLAP